jgi:ANTAR domain-containing protein
MTTDWVPAQLLDMEGRRILDTAVGILIGLHRCSADAAFHELLGAAQRHGFPAFPMAWALIHLAGGGTEYAQTSSAAQSAARHEWGQFFAPSVAPTG